MGIHYILFKVIRSVLEDDSDSLLSTGLCCIGIITINFCNSLHVDAGDNMDPSVYEEVIARLELLLEKEKKTQYVTEALRFLEWAKSVSVATTCLYQHIFDEEGEDEEEEIICYFPMLASVSLRLKPWLVHHFFASKISHW